MTKGTGFIKTKELPLTVIILDGEWPLDQDKLRSMAAQGQIDPIIGWMDEDQYKVTDGRRRTRAAKELGFSSLHCDIYDCELNAIRAALAAEVRSDNPMAKASLISTGGSDLSPDDLWQIGAISKAEAKRLKALVTRLPKDLRSEVEHGSIKVDSAKALLKLPDAKAMHRAWKLAQAANDDRPHPRKAPTIAEVKAAVRRVRGELQPQLAIPSGAVVEVKVVSGPAVNPLAVAGQLRRLMEDLEIRKSQEDAAAWDRVIESLEAIDA